MSNEPISEQFRLAAKAWVDADAAANLLEETKSAFLSQMMLQCGNVPVSKAEMTVKGSREWEEFIDKMVVARKEANFLKVKMEFLRMKFSEWNNAEANKRAEQRL